MMRWLDYWLPRGCGWWDAGRMTTSPVTVYVVHACEYDNNGAEALFATRELAEQHAATLNAKRGELYDVAEYPLLDAQPMPAKTYARAAMVHRVTGETRGRHGFVTGEWDYERGPETVRVMDDPSGWTTIHVHAHSAANAEELLASAIAGKLRADV